jgi:hypothetical protein
MQQLTAAANHEVENLRHQVNALTAKLAQKDDSAQTVLEAIIQKASHKTPPMPHVDYFDEKQDVEIFVDRLKCYFEVTGSFNDRQKVFYATSRLKGTPAIWASGFSRYGDKGEFEDFDDFVKKLSAAWGNRDRIYEAENNLHKVRQGEMSVAELESKIRRWGLIADWNDQALRGTFYHALNRAVKDKIDSQGAYHMMSLNDLTRAATAIDSRNKARYESSKSVERTAPMDIDQLAALTIKKTDLIAREQRGHCLCCDSADHSTVECDSAVSTQAPMPKPTATPSSSNSKKNFVTTWKPNQPVDASRESAQGLRAIASSSGITVILRAKNGQTVTALLDTGATANFVAQKIASRMGWSFKQKRAASVVFLADGTQLPEVTKEAFGNVEMAGQSVHLVCDVIPTTQHNVVLGLPFFQKYRPEIDWTKLSLISLNRPTIQYFSMLLVRPTDDDEPDIQDMLFEEDETKPREPTELPEAYKDFSAVFDKKMADVLPEHRPYDMAIDLQPGATVPWGPIYTLSTAELQALKDYLDDSLAKGAIRPSKSPAGAPLLFVKKKDGTLRPCVDYRRLNEITVKNRCPLPLIGEMLQQVGQSKARVFTKIDLRAAYNLVRIKKGDEWKTAFRCRYGHFEYQVMPFGLTNAPATFQQIMNDIFRDMLDQFIVIYIDDLLIYSRDPAEHPQHVRKVLERLNDHCLYAKLEKCEFSKKEVEFVGFKISGDGISMDSKKIESIIKWETPRSVKDIQKFLGFANFYRNFIPEFSRTVLPLTQLLKKDQVFEWNAAAQDAFDNLKTKFTTAPILGHADATQEFTLETDASDFAISGILSQRQNDGELHPVAYYSRKMEPAERNYEIHDKELLAIIACLKEWRYLLIGAENPTKIITDHKNLLYFAASRVLKQRHARWALFLNDFNYVLIHRPGELHGKADALSRRAEYEPTIEERRIKNVVIPTAKFLNALTYSTEFDARDSLLQRILQALPNDEFYQHATKLEELPTHMSVHNGLLLVHGRTYVPKQCQLEVLQLCHDSLLAGHAGFAKTTALLLRAYWWPRFRRDVNAYIRSCDTCQRSKSSRQLPAGLLQPLPTPQQPWKSLSMDFITDLPNSEGFDSILVVIDRFTKMGHFIPCRKTITAPELAKLFLTNIFRLHGLPLDIVSDRGSVFTAQFWRALTSSLNIQQNLSSAFHPESDGQTERVNQVLEQYLRCYVDYQQTNWPQLLPLAEFCYNNSEHSSLKCSPFRANYGYDPVMDLSTTPIPDTPSTVQEHITQLQNQFEILINELQLAQQTMKRFADRNRRPSPEYSPGDKVWLVRRNIKTTRPCSKLDHKKLGPFKIIERINSVAYRLQLPQSMSRLANVFHTSLLEPYVTNDVTLFKGRTVPPPPPVTTNEDIEYEVAEILDSRKRGKQIQYLVAWRGYGPEENTWEPIAHLVNCKQLLSSFHQQFPNKPRAPKNFLSPVSPASTYGGDLS